MSISYTQSLFWQERGVHSWSEKHIFTQKKSHAVQIWEKAIRRLFLYVYPYVLAPEVTFSCKGYFFQLVIPNARLWFAFSPPSLSTRRRQGIDIWWIIHRAKWRKRGKLLLDRNKYIINIKSNSIDGLWQCEILYWRENLIAYSYFSVRPYCTSFARSWVWK